MALPVASGACCWRRSSSAGSWPRQPLTSSCSATRRPYLPTCRATRTTRPWRRRCGAPQNESSEPRSGPAWGELGEVFYANELEAQSGVCFAQAERFEPNNPRWPYFRGWPVLNRGDRRGALPYFQRAADLAEAAFYVNDAPRLLLAETLLALGSPDEAEEHYRRVLARHPDDVRAHYGLGLLAMARDDWPFIFLILAHICTRLRETSRRDGGRGATPRSIFRYRVRLLPAATHYLVRLKWNIRSLLPFRWLSASSPSSPACC